MRLPVAIALLSVSSTADAALCTFLGSVPEYVMCIADQASNNEDRLDTVDATLVDHDTRVTALEAEVADLRAMLEEHVTPPGGSEDRPATSCLALLEEDPDAESGLYWLDPAGSGAFEAWCDMDYDGGGWTLVGKGREGWGNGADAFPTAGISTLDELAYNNETNTVAAMDSALVSALVGGRAVDGSGLVPRGGTDGLAVRTVVAGRTRSVA